MTQEEFTDINWHRGTPLAPKAERIAEIARICELNGLSPNM